jgi:hypothetical protein
MKLCVPDIILLPKLHMKSSGPIAVKLLFLKEELGLLKKEAEKDCFVDNSVLKMRVIVKVIKNPLLNLKIEI